MDSLNGVFNNWLDVALVVAERIGEVPLVALTLGLVVAVSLGFGVRASWARRRRRALPFWRPYRRALSVVLGLACVFYFAERTDAILRELREQEFFLRMDTVHRRGDSPSAAARDESSYLIDRNRLESGLERIFGSVLLDTEALGSGIAFAGVRTTGRRPTASYVTVVDLTDPAVRIELTPALGPKSLTSSFGREHGCVVAVNGEAGTTPALDASLGRWQGAWVVQGTVVPLRTSPKRPLLCFDRHNRARYVAANTDCALSKDAMYNTIWGRGDLLLDGEYVPPEEARWKPASPRTVMGIDAAGDRLILMVVDGRQPYYSDGMDLETAARVFALFGARDAMWCDQGGSSVMYLQCLGADVSRPSDGHERPTYTHFGIALNTGGETPARRQ